MGSSRGMTLLHLLVVISLLGLVGWGFTTFLSGSFRSVRHLEIRRSFTQSRELLFQSIDCQQSLPTVPPPGGCQPTNYLTLRDKDGNAITTALEPSGPYAGSGRFGEWAIRTTCDEVNRTLTIQLALPLGTGFAEDPLRKDILNFGNTRLNPVFGPVSTTTQPLCGERFGAVGATGCDPQTQRVVAVNFQNQTVTCADGAANEPSTPPPSNPPPPPPPPPPSCGSSYTLRINCTSGLCQVPNPTTGTCSCPPGCNPVCVQNGFSAIVQCR